LHRRRMRAAGCQCQHGDAGAERGRNPFHGTNSFGSPPGAQGAIIYI
jgi:hypothetical protein